MIKDNLQARMIHFFHHGIDLRRIQYVMIMPAIGRITVFDRCWIMLNTMLFHPWGVCPSCVAISPVFGFTSVNIVERLESIMSFRRVRIHSSIASNKESNTDHSSFLPSEQAGKLRNELRADQNNAAASHELLDALGFRTRIIVAISFGEIDSTPNTEACADGYDHRLENA